ncbi:MAG: molybdopterin molybdotransferase MoeA [Halanaerobiales bacterium]
MRNFLDLKTAKEFWTTVKEQIELRNLKKEMVNFENSINRVLADEIIASVNLPSFNRSTVDGYAVRSRDIQGVSESLPAYLDLIGEVVMGKVTKLLVQEGEAVYIPTGGMLPEGADCVVMVEHTEKISEKLVECHSSVGVGENIIKKGEEIEKGELIFNQGHRIKPRDMGALAGLGYTNVKVNEKPKIIIISTGDELIPPGKKLKFGQIRDINTHTISSLLKETGVEVIKAGIIEDTYSKLKQSIKDHLDADLILVSGGSSAGIKDITVDVIDKLGKPGVLIHGLKVKPGKPTILGQIDKTPIMGLPGHPGSAWMITNKFVKPFVKIIGGEYDVNEIENEIKKDLIKQSGVLNRNLSSKRGREETVPVKIIEKDGKIYADPILGKSSFMRIFIESKGYIEIESENEGLKKGTDVEIIYFN